MTDRVKHISSRQIESEAFAWVAQIDTGKLSPADEAAFNEWLQRSPAHLAEFRAAIELSKDLGILSELLEPLQSNRVRSKSRVMYFAPRALAAASLAFVAVLAVRLWPIAPTPYTEFYSTQVGEYLTTELPDGSVLKLNTNSAAEVEIGNRSRIIRLAKGEAFFDVASDPEREFVVFAGDNVAKAIGTSFSVRIKNENTELIVLEGIVEFSARKALESAGKSKTSGAKTTKDITPALKVTAGHRVAPTPSISSASVKKLTLVEKSSRLSWTEGLFDFSGLPLEEVINEINRHTTLSIEIADPELKSQKFGGIFRIGDVDLLLDALEETGVEVDEVSASQVILRAEQ